MDIIEELRRRRQLTTLAKRLRPPVSRQAIQKWDRVPYHYLRQVATLTGVPPDIIRPDLKYYEDWAVPKIRSALWLRAQ